MTVSIVLPEVVYHGTSVKIGSKELSAFKRKLLNKEYWNYGRDFGLGFYVTHLVEQPKPWAKSSAAKRARSEGEGLAPYIPCILIIEVNKNILESFDILVFTDASKDWGKFILDHRLQEDENDSCRNHTDIVIGYMADNDTGDLVAQYKYGEIILEEFLDRIQIDQDGNKISMHMLGNQYAFCNEGLENALKLTGCYLHENERWLYYGIEDPYLSRIGLL